LCRNGFDGLLADDDSELCLGHVSLTCGNFHTFSDWFKIRKSSFDATSLPGKCLLALTVRLSIEFSASMALVV